MVQLDKSSPNGTGHHRVVQIPEAAAALGISIDATRKRIQRGQLDAFRQGGRWYVRLDWTPVQSTGLGPRTGLDRQRTAPRVSSGLDRELIDQLRADLSFLQEELRRKDAIIAAFAQRLPELAAPATAPATPTPRRPWWRLWQR